MSNIETKLNGVEDNTRRTFMKNSGLTVGGLIVGGAVGSLLGRKPTTKTEQASAPVHEMAANPNQALMFFTPDEFKVVEAAAEQIFPKTDVGPGAKELLVAYYIDHQMAGTFGNNSREYMTGPFYPNEATPELGYQTHLTRKEVMTLGINALNDEATKRFKSKETPTFKFNELKEEQQVEILKDFEADKVKIKGATTATYVFSLLRKVTIEGAYADPMYGGNKDMAGWKMKEFPGHQGSYANVLDKEFQKIEPKSLNSQHTHSM